MSEYDAIDELRSELRSREDRARERRINITFRLCWAAFVLIAVILWVTR